MKTTMTVDVNQDAKDVRDHFRVHEKVLERLFEGTSLELVTAALTILTVNPNIAGRLGPREVEELVELVTSKFIGLAVQHLGNVTRQEMIVADCIQRIATRALTGTVDLGRPDAVPAPAALSMAPLRQGAQITSYLIEASRD